MLTTGEIHIYGHEVMSHRQLGTLRIAVTLVVMARLAAGLGLVDHRHSEEVLHTCLCRHLLRDHRKRLRNRRLGRRLHDRDPTSDAARTSGLQRDLAQEVDPSSSAMSCAPPCPKISVRSRSEDR